MFCEICKVLLDAPGDDRKTGVCSGCNYKLDQLNDPPPELIDYADQLDDPNQITVDFEFAPVEMVEVSIIE